MGGEGKGEGDGGEGEMEGVGEGCMFKYSLKCSWYLLKHQRLLRKPQLRHMVRAHKNSSVVPAIFKSIHKQRGVSYLGISAKATRPEPHKALLKDGTDQQWAVRAATDSAKDYLQPL